ncbi:MAG: hypothetical protein LBU31_02000 [Coriobacteriales bacterium]|jgi:hypothetical protein|nr:hypothetical protein [Coriobacteriales bacterium]
MKRLVTILLAGVLALSSVGLLAGCGAGDKIEGVTVGTQESSGVKISNYKVTLKSSVDWAALSNGEREKIAVAGFDAAQKKIAEDGIFQYNIIGLTADGQPAFQYDRENQKMIISVDSEVAGEVAVTPPQ